MASRISVPSSFAALRRRPAAVGAAGFFLLLSLGLLASSGCTLSVAGIDDGSGGTSTTASTGTGGTECIDGSECSDGNPCTDDVCTKGKCDNPANDKIVPTDPNPCTKDECKNGVQSHTNEPAGKPCGTDLKCDAGGVCQCTANEQCGAPTSCVKPTCDLVKGCVMVLPTDPLPDPTPNDCKGVKCDGMGNEVAYNEDADKPVDDGVVCTDDLCTAGVGSHPASAVGSACMGSNVCKAAGMCVFCTGNFGCVGEEYCFNEASCASCKNASKDGDETDLNCGGTHCPKCEIGLTCVENGDCVSAKCNSGKCISCMDGLQNGDESDVDCGGTCAGKCIDGNTCNVGGDCASNSCVGGKCISCMDGLKNGSETDVDCGGTCAGKCAVGKVCAGGGDCGSTFCAEGVCCASSCAGTCLSCNQPGKAGTCGIVPSGIGDPGTCGGAMLCDGGGVCAAMGATGGTKPFTAMCAANNECFNDSCKAGYCKLNNGDACAKNWDCGSYNCAANVCASCATNADCPMMNTCMGGRCKLSSGELCGGNGDCNNGNCVGNPKKCM